jgi:outer membrane protein
MRTPVILSLLVVLSAVSAAPAVAQSPDTGGPDGYTLPPLARAVLDSAVTLELATVPGQPLDLAGARSLALSGATAVRIARAEVDAARGAVERERGSYEPEIFAEGSYRDSEVPSASVFAPSQTEETRGEAGVRWRAPQGTQLSASLSAVRQESNGLTELLRPRYDSYGELRLTQPLLQGAGAGSRGELTAAERTLEAAELRLQDARLATEAAVEVTYWALYAAGRDLAVQQLIADRARQLVAEARTRDRAGLAGPSDVANARVFEAEQRQALLDARESLGDASDALANLVGTRPDDPETLFRAVDDPPAEFPVPAAVDLVAAVIERNNALRAIEQDVAAARARHDQARRNALPTLDLFGSLGGTGLTGVPQEVQFGEDTFTTAISGNVGESITEALSYEYPTWQVGLNFAVPLGGGRQAGERARLAAEVVRGEEVLESTRRDLADQVRSVHRALAGGGERLAAAREGVDAASEQVRIGILEYENGRTSAFELVRLAGDLASAQQRYSRALVRTARAAAVLRQLTGGAYPAGETNP